VRECWFSFIDTPLDKVGLAASSRYTTRLRFELKKDPRSEDPQR
jgi:hypothetical protein